MTNIICSVCDHAAERFEPVGESPQRRNAKSPHCGSYERYRLIWWYMREHNLVKDGMRLLDIAPMPSLVSALLYNYQLSYVSIDYGQRPAQTRMNLESLAFRSDQFDAILCMHVLEHVNHDVRALEELVRVLRPRGWAVLMVPIDENRSYTDEDPNLNDPEERARRFGQHDHVRRYGKDFLQRCANAGFRMQVIDMHKEKTILEKYALMPNEKIYIGWRQ